MILLENLFNLILIILLVLLYFYIIKIVYMYIRQLIKLKNIKLPTKEIFSIVPTSKIAKILLLFFILFNFSMQMANRDKWINKNTTNHNAKEYLVTNLSLQFYRKTLNTIFEVDSNVMKPLNKFSEYLYKKAEKLLPKNDGEKYYWRYRFFNYFYVRGTGGYVPDYNPYHPKPLTKQQKEIFDSMYEVIKGLAILTIKDKKIDEEKYKAYIATAKYYVTYRFVPYGKYVVSMLSDRRKVALKDKIFMQKNKNILEWTQRFQKEYKEDKKLKEFIDKNNPILGVSYSIVINDLTEDILFKMIIDKNLKCNNKMIDIYIDKSLISKNSPLSHMSESQQDIVKDFTFNTMYYRLISYKLNKQCNKKIELGYPSEDWIKNELPSIKKRWLNQDDISTDNNIILIDINSSNFTTF